MKLCSGWTNLNYSEIRLCEVWTPSDGPRHTCRFFYPIYFFPHWPRYFFFKDLATVRRFKTLTTRGHKSFPDSKVKVNFTFEFIWFVGNGSISVWIFQFHIFYVNTWDLLYAVWSLLCSDSYVIKCTYFYEIHNKLVMQLWIYLFYGNVWNIFYCFILCRCLLNFNFWWIWLKPLSLLTWLISCMICFISVLLYWSIC